MSSSSTMLELKDLKLFSSVVVVEVVEEERGYVD
jgi:hypothetical protein